MNRRNFFRALACAPLASALATGANAETAPRPHYRWPTLDTPFEGAGYLQLTPGEVDYLRDVAAYVSAEAADVELRRIRPDLCQAA